MLDRLRQQIAPATIDAELAEINARLDAIYVEREEVRLSYGQMVANGEQYDMDGQAVVKGVQYRLAAIDEEKAELRARRRVLLDLKAPVPAAQTLAAQVPMPPDLVAAITALETARAERQRLLREGWKLDQDDAAAQGKQARKIHEVEDRIADLRRRRAELIAPYNADVNKAVSPLVHAAATKLLAAAIAMREATNELAGLAVMLPPMVPGHGTGLENAANIDLRPTSVAQDLAETLLRANPQ
jgi:chromosome segregation ATPase